MWFDLCLFHRFTACDLCKFPSNGIRHLLEGEVDVRHQRRHISEGVAEGMRQTCLCGDAHLAKLMSWSRAVASEVF